VFEVVLITRKSRPIPATSSGLCANTGARLHLVEPLGFALTEVPACGAPAWTMRSWRRADSSRLGPLLCGWRTFAAGAALCADHQGHPSSRQRRVSGRAMCWSSVVRRAGCRQKFSPSLPPSNACACRCGQTIAASTCPTPSPSRYMKPGGRSATPAPHDSQALPGHQRYRPRNRCPVPSARRPLRSASCCRRERTDPVGNRHLDAQRRRAALHLARGGNAFGNMAQFRVICSRGLPVASNRPTRRLRERSPVQVRNRSPMPDKPMKVSARPPSALPKRAISCNPRVSRAARAFMPSPRPSQTPVAMAMTFLTAPPTSAPITSSLA
jgi:hypothetical protein